MPSLWLAMALLAADGGGGLRFEGSVAAGGGYDANLLAAPGGESAGSPVASVSAAGGAAFPTLTPDGAFTGPAVSASLVWRWD